MKHRLFHTALIAGVVSVLSAAATHAQTGQVLLPSPVAGSAPIGTGQDLLIDPFNSGPATGLFLAINSASSGASVFRLTPTDATSSRYTIEPVDYGLFGAYCLAHNHDDGLYAVGYSVTTTGTKGRTKSTMSWKVRRSPSAGQGNLESWQEDDSFNLTTVSKGKTTTYNSGAYGVAADTSGNVLVCGWANDGNVNHWIIRKRVGEKAWDTVLNRTAADGYSIPYKLAYVPQWAAHFVVGILNERWTVLRSADGGETWSPSSIDEGPEAGIMASAQDVASDSRGNIYVAGVRGRDGQNRGWVLRKSSNGGDDWETLLDKPSAIDSWTARISIDGADAITLAGNIDDGTLYQPRWSVVRNIPGQDWSGSSTASWESAIFPFGEDASPKSKGRGMVTDALGNLFLTGDAIDWTDPDDGTYYSGTRVGLLRLVP